MWLLLGLLQGLIEIVGRKGMLLLQAVNWLLLGLLLLLCLRQVLPCRLLLLRWQHAPHGTTQLLLLGHLLLLLGRLQGGGGRHGTSRAVVAIVSSASCCSPRRPLALHYAAQRQPSTQVLLMGALLLEHARCLLVLVLQALLRLQQACLMLLLLCGCQKMLGEALLLQQAGHCAEILQQAQRSCILLLLRLAAA